MTKHLHYFLIKAEGKNQKPFRIGVEVVDAKKPVTLKRRLMDVLAGTEGLSITCANAQCTLREFEAATGMKAYLAEFTQNRAFIVDRMDKNMQPIRCVRFAHNQGDFQNDFDKKGKNYFTKLSSDEFEGDFTLYPPPKTVAPGLGTARRGSKTSGTPGDYASRKRKHSSLGRFANYVEATKKRLKTA